VKGAATRLGIAVLQPGASRTMPNSATSLLRIAPEAVVDAIIVVGYGRIIPQW